MGAKATDRRMVSRARSGIRMIPDHTIARIRDAVDLAVLVQEYVQLRKAGSRLIARCPFHDENTASFGVRPNGHWKCFGCGAGGDAVSFLSKIEGISWLDAVKVLSIRTGIPLDGQRETRIQRAYSREENDFAQWWWKQECERLAVRLSAYVRLGTEEEAEAAGATWRAVHGLPPMDRRALAERCATADDRWFWKWDKAFAEAWVRSAA